MARLRTVQEFLALEGDEAPTPAELKLVEACRAGEQCVLGDGTRPEVDSPERRVRAELLRLLILGGTEGCGLHESGVWMEGAWISRELDLRFATGRGQFVTKRCHFTHTPSLQHAQLSRLILDGSYLPGLNALQTRVVGSASLRYLVSTKTITVDRARIGGQLTFQGASLNGGKDGALTARLMELQGDIILRDTNIIGGVFMRGAKIRGDLSCTDAILKNGSGDALHAQSVDIGQNLILRGLTTKGSINLNEAKIGGQFNCRDATFDGDKKKAIRGQRLQVKSGFLIRGFKSISGDIYLPSAHVGDFVDDYPSWGRVSGNVQLAGFEYDQLHTTSNLRKRLAWLSRVANYGDEFTPQPYTQLAKVLLAMGHNRAARQVLAERERLLGEEQFREDKARLAQLWSGGAQDDQCQAQRVKGDIGNQWIKTWSSRFWNKTIGTLVGYGYLPERGLIWATGATLLATVIYFITWRTGGIVPDSDVVMVSAEWHAAMKADPVAPSVVWANGPSGTHYETFNAGAYALDIFLPIIELGQDAAWASTTTSWPKTLVWGFTWILQLFGWIVSALGVAAITGIMQRDRE